MASAVEVKGAPISVLGMGYPRPRDGGTGRDINGLGLEESTRRTETKYLSSKPPEKRERKSKSSKKYKKEQGNKVERKDMIICQK